MTYFEDWSPLRHLCFASSTPAFRNLSAAAQYVRILFNSWHEIWVRVTLWPNFNLKSQSTAAARGGEDLLSENSVAAAAAQRLQEPSLSGSGLQSLTSLQAWKTSFKGPVEPLGDSWQFCLRWKSSGIISSLVFGTNLSWFSFKIYFSTC